MAGWDEIYDALRTALEALDEFTITDDSANDKYLKKITEYLTSPFSKLDATAVPTVNDDVDLGYEVGSHWVNLATDKVYVCTDPSDGGAVWKELTSDGGALSYVCVADEKAQSTNGGTFNSGAWRVRTLNTERADDDGLATLSSNQITLAAGKYAVRISAPAFGVNSHKAKLYNVTDTADALIGTVETANATYSGMSRSFIVGQISLASAKVLEVQHYCSFTKNNTGFGPAFAAAGVVEVYTVAEFWRLGDA
jgi:hypothetical protein